MSKSLDWLIKNAQSIITIGSVILAVVAWFFMMNGLPTRMESAERRVTTLEKDVSELKTSLASQSTKLDMTLNAVYEIRAVLLKGK